MRGIIGHTLEGRGSIATSIMMTVMANEIRLRRERLNAEKAIDSELCLKMKEVKSSTLNIRMAVVFTKMVRKIK